MADIFDTVLLIALPASGKSEVRTFLTEMNPETFHMGPTVQIDDYPYVHMQLRIDEEVANMGLERPYHAFNGGPFKEAWNWAALVYLLDEDWHEIQALEAEQPENAALRLFERLDNAAAKVGGEPPLKALPKDVYDKLAVILEDEARKLFDDKAAVIPDTLEGKTIVIEFARGGPMNAKPLPPGYGYAGCLPALSAELLERAVALYVWVDPAESRRKNRARAKPGREGQASILFHGTPEPVMYEEYGRDDIEELLAKAAEPDTLPVEAHGKVFNLPFARFDNRVDLTTFLREPPSEWSQEDIQAIYGGLEDACRRLWARVQA